VLGIPFFAIMTSCPPGAVATKTLVSIVCFDVYALMQLTGWFVFKSQYTHVILQLDPLPEKLASIGLAGFAHKGHAATSFV